MIGLINSRLTSGLTGVNEMKLERFPNFFSCCKNASPNKHIDLQEMSRSDIDCFMAAYLRDIPNGANHALADAIMSLATPEEIKNDVYSSLENVMESLCQNYNDWVDLQFNQSFDRVFNSLDAHLEHGVKPSDFC